MIAPLVVNGDCRATLPPLAAPLLRKPNFTGTNDVRRPGMGARLARQPPEGGNGDKFAG